MDEQKTTMTLYNAFRSVPEEAKKPITAGRLKGFTDINPMWRIKVLTEVFGPCGIGWWYKITDKRLEGNGQEIRAFVDIELYYRWNGEISQPVPGTGGASFLTMEKNGAYTSDECYKMALTDAISVAAKALGVAADVFYAKDRDKYTQPEEEPQRSYGQQQAPRQQGQQQTPPQRQQAGQRPTPQQSQPEEGFVPTCADCGVRIDDRVHDYSVRRFGRPLCRDCQKKA